MGKFLAPSITTADRTGLVLDQREVVYDTDLDKFYGGDGVTSGGFEIGSGGGGGSSWTIVTITDSDFTAADDTCYDCQSGDITADRVITVTSITTRFRVINGQEAKTLRFSGATVYNMGGTEAVTYVMQLACVTIELINGKLIITG